MKPSVGDVENQRRHRVAEAVERRLPVRDPKLALRRTTYAVTAGEPSAAATAMVDALGAEAGAWAWSAGASATGSVGPKSADADGHT